MIDIDLNLAELNLTPENEEQILKEYF